MKYVTGFHAILETVKSRPRDARLLLAAGAAKGPRIKEILQAADKLGLPADVVEKTVLDGIDPDHRGIALQLAEQRRVAAADLDEFLDSPPRHALALVLDHIEDPQNLGAILRSADAFGVDFIIAPTKRAAPLSAAAETASAGASAWVNIAFVANLADAVERLKAAGFWIFCADMEGPPISDTDLPDRCCFVLGNEGHGVSRLLRERSDGVVSIPMRGHVDSLNVSVSAAIFMHEYRRGRSDS